MMHLTISNQTYDSLRCSSGSEKYVVLIPPFAESPQFAVNTSLWLSGQVRSKAQTTVLIELALPHARNWQRVTVRADSPWTVYRKRMSRNRHTLVVFSDRDTSCFLASIPDSVPLSSLVLPGTHETVAFYGWPISQCQYRSLDIQLHAGIRVVDIRLSIVDGHLISYHGAFPQFTPFADILVTLHNFLTSPTTNSETVVVSIKQEDVDTRRFPNLVRNEIVASPGGLQMWFLENRIPCLGEVRGKAVLFSRFGTDVANGIHPPIWPDSAREGFQWECDGTLVRTHDWYGIPSFLSISEKVSLATEILLQPSDSPIPTLSIAFTSASSIPFALPPIVARGVGWPKWGLGFEGVNDRIGKWLLTQLSSNNTIHQHHRNLRLASRADAGPRIRGWVLMDYYEDPTSASVVPLLVECNFRGRRAGEEGWVNTG